MLSSDVNLVREVTFTKVGQNICPSCYNPIEAGSYYTKDPTITTADTPVDGDIGFCEHCGCMMKLLVDDTGCVSFEAATKEDVPFGEDELVRYITDARDAAIRHRHRLRKHKESSDALKIAQEIFKKLLESEDPFGMQ